jgi:hypothetical protein
LYYERDLEKDEAGGYRSHWYATKLDENVVEKKERKKRIYSSLVV